MKNNHDIDKKFNEVLKTSEEPVTFPGFDKVWSKVEGKLDQRENKKKIVPVWFPYGIAASLIIGLGAFYFIRKKQEGAVLKPQIVQNNPSKVNSKVQGIDSVAKSNIQKEMAAVPSQKENQDVAVYSSAIPEPVKTPVILASRQDDFTVADQPDHDGFLEKKDELEKIELRNKRNLSVPSSSIPEEFSAMTNSPLQGKTGGVQIAQNAGKGIEEVVVLGYSKTSAKSNMLSSSVRVSPEKLEYRPNVQVLNSNKGTARDIAVNNGIPGPSKSIVIRGTASLNSSIDPLYIINGKVSDSKIFQSIDSNRIQSVQVLKDSSLAALYGSKALNGVIVIKTRKLSKKEKKAIKHIEQVQDSILKSKQGQLYNSEEYDAFIENPFELTKNQPLSTFSIDVDKAAYSNIRRMINNGEIVNKNAVRIEELINYFNYNYPQPKNDQPFSINTEYHDAPWNPKHKLLKIGLQGKNIPMGKLPSSNFVFLIDVSGSMDAANKLPLLKSSFKLLLDQLRPQDKVGIVVYAGSAGMVLPPTSAREKDKIINALDKLQAGGSTAGGEGIELAYELAGQSFIKGGNNRVIIATDGDFNVGTSSQDDLQKLIEEKRKSGVFLTCLGFGMGNFKDNRMETLANKGNGNYAYIDNMQEANKFLGKEFAGSMYAIAKDVKIQIGFNPKFVKSYRLIGYENRRLKNEDFTNDKIDAGELGSGHTVTAFYEVIPSDVKSDFLPAETGLKYTCNTSSNNFQDELATLKLRYKKPDGDTSAEIVQTVKDINESISSASDDFKFASSVAWFGLILRNSDFIKNKDLKDVERLSKKGKGYDDEGYRSEFMRLVETYNMIKR